MVTKDMASTVPTSEPHDYQVVADAFVRQYYAVLLQSPDEVYKFYEDSSIITRPNVDGLMKSVTTLQAINELALPLHFKDFPFEVEHIDSQPSYNGGVFVLVTGKLTMNDGAQLKLFTQTFFLIQKCPGVYIILNDTFKYVCEIEIKQSNHISFINNDFKEVTLTTEPEPTPEEECYTADLETLPSNGDSENGAEAYNHSELEHKQDVSVAIHQDDSLVDQDDKKSTNLSIDQDDARSAIDESDSVTQEESRQSFADIIIHKDDAPIHQEGDKQDTSAAIHQDDSSVDHDDKKSTNLSIDHNDARSEIDEFDSVAQEESKQSFADIVKRMKGSKITPAPTRPRAPLASNGKSSIANSNTNNEKTSISPSTKNQFEVTAPTDEIIPERKKSYEVEEHSIYIRNLPTKATKELLVVVFKKFGSVKRSGVLVKSREDGSNFAFVEFDLSSSAKSALKASSVMILDVQVSIEAKRRRTRAFIREESELKNVHFKRLQQRYLQNFNGKIVSTNSTKAS